MRTRTTEPAPEPAPLQARFERAADTAGVTWTQVIRLWRNEDAADCRMCAGCSYAPGPAGQGVCTILAPGALDESAALALRRPAGFPRIAD